MPSRYASSTCPSKQKRFISRWKIKKGNHESISLGADTVLNSGTWRGFIFASCFLAGCNSEILEKQAEQLRQQEIQLARQRKEINDLLAGQKLQGHKAGDCSPAPRDYFDQGQTSSDRQQTLALYREGLTICADDDVAHYELGNVMVEQGSYAEAEKELEAALKMNPA